MVIQICRVHDSNYKMGYENFVSLIVIQRHNYGLVFENLRLNLVDFLY